VLLVVVGGHLATLTRRGALTEGVEQGDFVEVRGRQWLVEAIDDAQPDRPSNSPALPGRRRCNCRGPMRNGRTNFLQRSLSHELGKLVRAAGLKDSACQ
jgi:hypothetical protein